MIIGKPLVQAMADSGERQTFQEGEAGKQNTCSHLFDFFVFYNLFDVTGKGRAMGTQDRTNEKWILSSWGSQAGAEGRWGERTHPMLIHKNDQLILGSRGPTEECGELDLVWSIKEISSKMESGKQRCRR